jgi:hypothetical protein
MREHTRWRLPAATFALILVSGMLVSGEVSDCTYLRNPDEFKFNKVRHYAERAATTDMVAKVVHPRTAAALDPTAIPRKNFIDQDIFAAMAGAGIQSAGLTTDTEFIRRVTLDLTGRIPSPMDVTDFVNDPNPSKRDALVDSLIGTPEFIDKWTMFLGDLFKNTSQSGQIVRYTQGRDAFYQYLKDAITTNKPYDQIAREVITSTGDTFVQGEANWPVGGTIAMGPIQDTYDGQAVNVGNMFLGVNVVDCLLCHNGAGHLTQVNLWGAQETRYQMWGLSAYFARTTMQRQVVSQNPTVAKYIVSDATKGEYQLNTTVGNRVSRQPSNGVSVIAPNYPFIAGSTVASGETRRQALARTVTADMQFSRAIVNYIWEKFMVEAFVSPSNTFDLARLDPNASLPSGWTVQPTNPQLLNALATWFQSNKYDLRGLMALITKSSAYQLSSTYPGTWSANYTPFYARHFVRRLDAEEVHDAIQKATGVMNTYTFQYLPSVQWAMQLPDPREPASNSAVAAFLNSFGRGDRDLNPRRSDPSGLQALNMMNNNFIMNRVHQNNQGSRVATILSQTTDPATIIQLLYQYTLARSPSPDEVALFLPMVQSQGARVGAESLQWILLNKMDFLYNY